MDPLFGQLYWLTGKLSIDRNNRRKATDHCGSRESFQVRRISIWMFPEGTRSRGRGLRPFKTEHFTRQLRRASRLFPCASYNFE
ncbi:1-acyl-sn-glycerol-3-phosphate acyltransferase [Shigella flexneri]